MASARRLVCWLAGHRPAGIPGMCGRCGRWYDAARQADHEQEMSRW